MRSKIVAFILIMGLSSCKTVLHRKEVMDLAAIGDKERPMKTDGYYYTELEEEAHPVYKNDTGGYSVDADKLYMQKLIDPLVLYKDGSVEVGLPISGMAENYLRKMNCGLPDVNSVVMAKKYFECLLMQDAEKSSSKFSTLFYKGVFRTDGNGITIQFYSASGPPSATEYYLLEKRGEILSDSTFVLRTLYDHRTKGSTAINEHYEFQPFAIPAHGENYILEHRDRFGE
jgi:hypothetical protein